jgi:hypothetical protein
MRATSYTYGANALEKYRLGAIYLRDEPLWLAVAGYLIDLTGYVSQVLGYVHLPESIKIIRDGHEYSLRDYYGSFGDLWHIYVFDALFQWHWNHPRAVNIDVEIGYDRLKELFGKSAPEYFTECEKDKEELDRALADRDLRPKAGA